MWLDTNRPWPLLKKLFLLPNPSHCFTIFIHIKFSNHELFTQTFVDTRALACFLDRDFVSWHNLALVKKNHFTPIKAIDVQLLVLGSIIEKTEPLKLPLEHQVLHIDFTSSNLLET